MKSKPTPKPDAILLRRYSPFPTAHSMHSLPLDFCRYYARSAALYTCANPGCYVGLRLRLIRPIVLNHDLKYRIHHFRPNRVIGAGAQR